MAFLEHIPTQNFYHYTSIEGLDGIVSSKKLWFSSRDGSNDPRELEFGRDKIISALTRVRHEVYPGQGGFFVSMLAGVLTGALRHQVIYTASFTSLRDSMPLWREYTASGDGVAIGFRPRALTDMHCRIQKVRYIRAEDQDELFHLVSEFVKSLEAIGCRNPEDIFNEENFETRIEVVTSLVSTIYSVKAHGWSYEDELRLSFASGRDRDEDTLKIPVTELPDGRPVYWREPKKRQTKYGDVAYYELPFGKFSDGEYDPSGALSDIVIGPNATFSEDEGKRILAKSGMRVPPIEQSDSIFR